MVLVWEKETEMDERTEELLRVPEELDWEDSLEVDMELSEVELDCENELVFDEKLSELVNSRVQVSTNVIVMYTVTI